MKKKVFFLCIILTLLVLFNQSVVLGCEPYCDEEGGQDEKLAPGDKGYYDQPVADLNFNTPGFSIAELRAANPSWAYDEVDGSISKEKIAAIGANSELLAQLTKGEMGTLIANGKKDFVAAMSEEDMIKHFANLEDFKALDYIDPNIWFENPQLKQLIGEAMVRGVKPKYSQTFADYMILEKGVDVNQHLLTQVGSEVQIRCETSTCDKLTFNYANDQEIELITNAFSEIPLGNFDVGVYEDWGTYGELPTVISESDHQAALNELQMMQDRMALHRAAQLSLISQGVQIEEDGSTNKISISLNGGSAQIVSGTAGPTQDGGLFSENADMTVAMGSNIVAGQGMTGTYNNPDSYISKADYLISSNCNYGCEELITATNVDNMYIGPDLITADSIGEGNVGDYLDFEDAVDTSFDYATDTYTFDEVRYLEITAPSDTGQDNKFVIINGYNAEINHTTHAKVNQAVGSHEDQ
jgi:hypothetical protein